ncbi:MAG: serine hydrolase [Steroidobacteraceae bacterium]
MNRSKSMSLIAWLAISAISPGVMAATPPPVADIGAVVERAMKAFNVPGMTVAVVADGKVLYSAGQGAVENGKPAAVDDRTLFQIGSVSKAFTAAAMALLVDEGRLDWDHPVIDYLPEFRMADPWVTREFTVRDLLTHRSGLPLGAGDLLMFPDGNAAPADIVGALRYLKPASSFRSEFAYDNLLYIVAGEVIARVAAMPFMQFLEQRLLQPLGMGDCVAYVERAASDASVATAHVVVDGNLQTTGTKVSELVAAAGGITCSARSMARWMQFMLGEGVTVDGRRLISAGQFAQLVQPVTLLPVPSYLAANAGTSLNAYALGWNVSTFYGERMLSHSGGVWGMTTHLAILPRQKLAVFASGNQMTVAPRAVVHAIVDQFMGEQSITGHVDWVGVFEEEVRKRGAGADDVVAKAYAARNARSRPSRALAAYAGTYRDPWYGTIRIELQDGRLWFRSQRNPPLAGPLEHFQYDTFVARWSDRRLNADAYVTFNLAPDGSVERIRMKAVSPATDFSYDFHDLDLVKEPEVAQE